MMTSLPTKLLLVYSLEEVSKPTPLISNEPLEASTTVKQGSVKIENDGPNIRQHLFYKALIRDLPNVVLQRRAPPIARSGVGCKPVFRAWLPT
jgi:hypothetical protein